MKVDKLEMENIDESVKVSKSVETGPNTSRTGKFFFALTMLQKRLIKITKNLIVQFR